MSAPSRRSMLLALASFGFLASSCGYRTIHGGAGEGSVTGGERYSVVLAASKVPDAVASDEVVAGVRDEFAKLGALASGSAYPRCEIEVLRADEASEGIIATPNADGRLLPESRATRVGLVARAWVVRTKDGPRERDTGDVRAMEIVAVAQDAKAATFRQSDALRSAGRRVGRAIGSRILGLPAASDE